MAVARPRTYRVTGRTPGCGPVLAVLTGAPTDTAVAAHAADLARSTGTLLIAAAAVSGDGPAARTACLGITARVAAILHSAGVACLRSTITLPAGAVARRALPVTPIHGVVHRFGVVTVVTASLIGDPTGVLRPAPLDRIPAH